MNANQNPRRDGYVSITPSGACRTATSGATLLLTLMLAACGSGGGEPATDPAADGDLAPILGAANPDAAAPPAPADSGDTAGAADAPTGSAAADSWPDLEVIDSGALATTLITPIEPISPLRPALRPSADESVAVRLANDYDDATGRHAVRVDLLASLERTDVVPADGRVTLTLAGEGSWDVARLAEDCTVDGARGKVVSCAFGYAISRTDEYLDVRRSLFVVSDVDTTVEVTADIGVSTIERTPDDNVSTARLPLAVAPPHAFLVDAPSHALGDADGQRTLAATIAQASVNRPVGIDVVVEVPDGLVMRGAELLSDGARDLVSRCVVDADVVCRMDDVVHTETLTLALDYFVIDEGVHELRWRVATDTGAENAATTRVEYVRSTAALQALVDVAAEGDTVTLPAGRYAGTLDGRRLADLVLRGADGDEPTVLISVDPEIPLLENLGEWATVGNLELRTTGAPVLRASDENVTVADSLIAPVDGRPHALTSLVDRSASHRFLNNRILGWGAEGSGSCEALIARPVGGSHYATYIYLQHNLFVGNHCDRVVRMDLSKVRDYADTSLFVTNNTFVDNPRLFAFAGGVATMEAAFRNNVVVGAESILEVDDGLFTVERSWVTAGLVSSRNLVWNSERGSLLTGDLLARTRVSLERTDLNVDPAFVDAAAGDYRPALGSPVVDAGVDPGPYEWTWDDYRHENLAPPADAVIAPADGDGDGVVVHDIGAFERAAAD